MNNHNLPTETPASKTPRSREPLCYRRVEELPFKIERNHHTGLTAQLASGLRQAILSGYFKPGDVLPTLEELATATKTSMRVPREAIDRLRFEGLVVPRRSVGSIVMNPKHPAKLGQILFILSDVDGSYYANVFTARLQQKMIEAGYLFNRISVAGDSTLADSGEFALSQSVTLVIVFCPHDNRIAKRLEQRQIPYVVIGEEPTEGAFCKGCIRFARDNAVTEFLEHCQSQGIKRILQVGFKGEGGVDITPLAEQYGIELSHETFRAPSGVGRLEQIQQQVMKRLLTNPLPDVDLIFFSDDFLAMGGLTALLALQTKIPEKLKIVTFANAGFGPVFPLSLTRLMMDPLNHAEVTAEGLITLLRTRKLPEDMTLASVYCHGETF